MQAIVNHANTLKARVEELVSQIKTLDRATVETKVVEYRDIAQTKFIALAVLVAVFVYTQVMKAIALFEASKYSEVVKKNTAPALEKAQPYVTTAQEKVTTFYNEKVHEKAQAFDEKYLLATVATIISQVQEATSPKEEEASAVSAAVEDVQEEQE